MFLRDPVSVFHLFNAAASVALFLFIARHIVPFKPKPMAVVNESVNITLDDSAYIPASSLYAASVISTHMKSGVE